MDYDKMMKIVQDAHKDPSTIDPDRILNHIFASTGYSVENPPPEAVIKQLKIDFAPWLPAFCFLKPDLEYCQEGVISFYSYRVSLAANVVFLVLFFLSFCGFAYTMYRTRRANLFSVAMMLGIVSEMIGYSGRIFSWKNQWNENPFLVQVCCLTVGPAFLAAGIYLCLRRIVTAFGPKNSRIPPKWYTRIFIPCDLISLALQAVGGALASVASKRDLPTAKGDAVMIAGLAFQVFTMFAFMLVAADFALRTYRASRHAHLPNLSCALDNHPDMVRLRRSSRFKGFLGALVVSTVCIFIRCVFRVIELSGGWTGPLMARQDLFIAFEGVMIVVSVVGLNFFHPALCGSQLFKPPADRTAGVPNRRRRIISGPRLVNFDSYEKSNGSSIETA
ncbi:RTA1 like protein [Colletotrichum abscissum]|uniref:RTA1 like protein n=4 Tax=Colletotrichum acutatum species complex TaxID=2707335 RepID=A0A9Q0B1P4_9PEZI|nr:RTA1 like protein [Colletotrichum lupini]XP_060320979.1 RTA1 like protein [Colletotrichum costaricense]XP_060382495.1 RTA1 like protein [Colletotrichum tamarilloi]XP_060392456.1 RTA1 like protein [Colletotrichum abscissum]KAI3540759.1 RTA1 like protein [Colletotrichum abscissum]KAK1477858.1 RTA1 like protein [Colletotrichum abscissum]KAK1499774.1 RTA1 like protein [Colletotrichum tamarilloi]KAK1540031.1 RTA1 like protein [Colletotrichum costaricense]UQC83070.1 RTA1 like protein [Colletot